MYGKSIGKSMCIINIYYLKYIISVYLSNVSNCTHLPSNNGTWENYLKDRWGYSNDWWVKLISASKVLDNIETNTNGIVLPKTERQARGLSTLEPAQ